MRLFTVGHSNHERDHFVGLLHSHDIQVVADIRSWPASRHVPWADSKALAISLRKSGIRYAFLGDQLGGRPDDPDAYNEAGRVLYGRVAASAAFQAGIDRLMQGISAFRIAVMCSEENPEHCHRRLLVAKVLAERGVTIEHMRGDGRLEKEENVVAPEGLLFANEDHWWISTRSVSRRRPRRTSSAA